MDEWPMAPLMARSGSGAALEPTLDALELGGR